jgi:hypothetical protein
MFASSGGASAASSSPERLLDALAQPLELLVQ